MSQMRTSCSPASVRMLYQAPSMSAMCVPGLAPGTTQGLPALRGRVASTPTAAAERWTVDGAVAGLPVDDADFRPVEIDMLLPQRHDLALAA